MKFLPTFTIALLLPILISAQFELEPNTFRVIAMDGLNMRNRPSKNAKIINGIPFLGLVKVLNTEEEWCKDTIGENTFYHLNETYHAPIIGHWVKASYGRSEGYVFSPYLAPLGENQEHTIDGVNTQFGLNFPGQTCTDNVYRNKDLFWYGLYKNSEGDYVWEELEIDYNITDAEIGWLDVNVTGGKKGLLFMFGLSDKTILGESIKGKFYSLLEQESYFIDYKSNKVNYSGKDLKLSYDLEEDRWTLHHYRSGKEQILNPNEYLLSSPAGLIWKGDMDEDGFNDYIIQYGEKSVQTILYLSSEAREGELLRPVAVFYTGYCC